MHSALFLVTVPEEEADWNQFCGDVYTKMKTHPSGVTRISPNAWLLELKEGTPMLGFLIAYAEARGFSYGLLPFQAEPEWLPDKFCPTSIDESKHHHRAAHRP